MSFNKVDEALKSVGITLQTTDHQFRSFTDVIMELADAWDSLDSSQKRYIATQFAGNRQQNRFLALVSNKDLLQQNLNVAEESEDTGTLQAIKALDSIESKLNQVQVAYQQFYTNLGAESVWKTLLDGTKNFINSLNSLPKAFGKIPLGAATVVADAISIIKDIGLRGISLIAKDFLNNMKTSINPAEVENTGKELGEAFTKGLKDGSLNNATLKQLQDEIVKQFNNKDVLYTFEENIRGSFNKYIEEYKKYNEELAKTGNQSLPKPDITGLQSAVSNAINELERLGIASEADAEKMRQLASSGNLEDFNTFINKLHEMGGAAEEFAQKLQQTAAVKVSNNLTGIGATLNVIANAMDKSSSAGRVFAGVMMSAGGALKAFGEINKYIATGGAFPWLAVAMAAITVVNGLATAIETDTEKLERLQKHAEELSNVAKEIKADERTLQSGIDKIEELKVKRLESAEAANEYQAAVEDLAEKFPELILGFDEAGNTILDLESAEDALAEARKKTLQATYDAAVAENEAKQQEVENAKEQIKQLKYNYDKEILTGLNASQNSASIVSNLANNLNSLGYRNEFSGMLTEYGNELLSGKLLPEDIISSSGILTTIRSALSRIYEDSGIEGIDESFEIKNYSDFKKAFENVDGLDESFENLIGYLDQINEGISENIQSDLEIVTSFAARLEEIDFNSEEGREEYNRFREAYSRLDKDTKDKINEKIFNVEELSKNIEQIVSFGKQSKGINNSLISSYLQLIKANEKGWEFLEENNQARLLLTNQLTETWMNSDEYKNKTWEEFKSSDDFKNAVNEFYEAYNQLGEDKQKLLEEIETDTRSYTAQDVKRMLGIGDDKNNPINKYIDNLYRTAEESQKQIEDIFKDYDTHKLIWNKDFLEPNPLDILQQGLKNVQESLDFPPEVISFINTRTKEINELTEDGFIQSAQRLTDQTLAFLSALYRESMEPQERATIMAILNSANLQTKEGIDEAIEQIQNSNVDDADQKAVIEQLETRKKELIDNVALSIQADLAQLVEEAEDDSKLLSKATSGLSVKETNELIQQAQSWGVNLSLKDFIPNGDKLIASENAFNEMQQGYQSKLKAAGDKAQENLNKAKSLGLYDGNNFSIPEFITEDQLRFFEQQLGGFSTDMANFVGEDTTLLSDVGRAKVEEIYKTIGDSLFEYGESIGILFQTIFGEANWNKGDYSSLVESSNLGTTTGQYEGSELVWKNILNVDEFNKYLTGESQYDAQTDPNLKTAVEKARGGVSTFLSDLLSKGVDQFNASDYAEAGIEKETFDKMSADALAVKNGELSYEEFVNRYAELTGDSIEAINNLIVQAIQQDNKTSEVAQRKAFSDLTIVGDTITGTEEQINALATALGNTNISDLLGQKRADGSYEVIITEAVQEALKNLNIIEQSIPNQLKAFSDSLSKAADYITKGSNDTAAMQQFADEYAKALGGKVGDYSWKELFNWDSNVEAYTLSADAYKAYIQAQKNKLNEAGEVDEEVARTIEEARKQLASTVDIDSFLKAENREVGSQAYNKLANQMRDYYSTIYDSETLINSIVEKRMQNMLSGGNAAVQNLVYWAEKEGTEVSSSDVEQAYRAEISQLENAFDQLSYGVGSLISGQAVDILKAAGYGIDRIEGTNSAVIKSIDDVAKAYEIYYNELKETGEATVAALNEAYAKVLETRDGSDVISALGDAASMTYTRLGEILASKGIKLTDELLAQYSDAIQFIGGGKVRITNFDKFATEIMGWTDIDKNSEEYISAFKTYNDSLIEMNRKAERNIVEEVQALKDAQAGDQINLTQLVSGLGAEVTEALAASLKDSHALLENGILTLEQNANIPAIIQNLSETAAENGLILQDSMAQLADTLNNVLENYASLINNGIEGSLTNTQAQQLQVQAQSLGYVGKLNFSRTVEGLKLSEESARRLYEHLRSVDGLQAKLVFDKLYESITDSHQGLKTISGTMAKIEKTQKQIAENERKINALRAAKENSRADQIEKENNKLKEQLSLYEQIRNRQRDDASSYDFMGQDLPEAFKGAENYWNSVGSAFKAMNKAGESGTMAIQDFYNIVNEMNNLAAISGNKLVFMGKTLDGSAESAASLIEKGFNALSNVDGSGVVIDLKKLGVQFKNGAADMQSGFQGGIKAMAQSQIDMLDAMIALMETVVAMQKLGEVDIDENGILSVDEIFSDETDDKGNKKFTATYDKIRKYLANSEELKPLLDNLKVNGISLRKLLDENQDAWREAGISEDEYAKIMTAFYQASISDNYDLENLISSVLDVLSGTGQVFSYYDKESKIETVIDASGRTYTVNWNSEKDKKRIYEAFEKAGYNKRPSDEEIREILNRGQAGKSKDQKEVFAYQLTYGLVTECKVDGKTKYQDSNGGLHDTIEEAVVENAFIKQKGEAQGERKTIEVSGKTSGYQQDYLLESGLSYSLTVGVDGKEEYSTTYKGKNGDEVITGNTYQEMIDILLDKATSETYDGKKFSELAPEEQIKIKRKLNLEVTPEIFFTGADGKEYDPSTDPETQQKLQTFLNQSHDKIQQALKQNEDGSYTITLDGGKLTVKAENENEAITKIQQAVDPLIVSISTGIKSAFTSDNTIGDALITAITTALTRVSFDGQNFTISDIPVTAEKITVDTSKATPVFGAITQENINSAKNWIESKKSSLTVSNVPVTVEKATYSAPIETNASALIDAATTTGKDVNAGLAAGMSDTTAITEKARGNINSIIGAMNTAAGVQMAGSGSTKTAQTGEDIARGLAQGLTHIDEAVTNGKTLVQQVIDAIQAYLDDHPLTVTANVAAGATKNTEKPKPQKTTNTPVPAPVTPNFSGVQNAISSIGTFFSNVLSGAISKFKEVQTAQEAIKTDKIEAIQTVQDAIKNDKVESIKTAQEAIENTKVVAIQEAQNSITHNKVDAIQTAQDSIKNDKVKDIQSAQSEIKHNKVDDIKYAQENISTNKIEALKNAINNLSGNVSLGIDIKVNTQGASSAIGSISTNSGSVRRNGNNASWNFSRAFAAGKDTLMGELGPELVVSHGRYFLVGQNGPEMVNLDEDAIVFNHLQTKKLIEKGKISSHGTPVTNERKATSMATGNFEGPAFASASEVLAMLKQLREMWRSLRDAKAKDIGAMAGKAGKTSKGSGADKTADETKDTEKYTAGIESNVERWYNWLQAIEATQYKINKLTKEYNILEKEGASTQEKLNNLQQQYKLRQENRDTRERLAKEQKKYRDDVIDTANQGLMSAFYQADKETGQVYLANDDAFQKFLKRQQSKGLAAGELSSVLAENGSIRQETSITRGLNKKEREARAEQVVKNSYGRQNKVPSYLRQYYKDGTLIEGKEEEAKKAAAEQFKSSKYTKKVKTTREIRTGFDFMDELQAKDEAGNLIHDAEDQLALIKEMGLFTNDLLTGIDQETEGWESQVVQRFYDKVEEDKESIESLTESIRDQELAALDEASAMQEINDKIRKLTKPIGGITKSLEKWYNETIKIREAQQEINKLIKEMTLLQKDQKINGKEIYENYKKQQESLRGQIAENESFITKRQKEAVKLAEKYSDLPIKIDEHGAATFSERKIGTVNGYGSINTSYTRSKTIKVGDKEYFVDTEGNYRDDQGILRDKNGNQIEGNFGQQAVETVTGHKAYNFAGKTIQELVDDLVSKDAYGNYNFQGEEAFQILEAAGYGRYMQYDENGNQLYDNLGELTPEEMEKAAQAAVTRLQTAVTEINQNNDEIVNLDEENLKLQSDLLAIDQALIDNQIEVENMVKDAVIQEHQDAIDTKKELKDALDDAASHTIEGLREGLEQERAMYDKAENQKQLETLQRQLEVAQRSGASLSKIQGLQDQVASAQKDMYFTEREELIDNIESSMQREIEALDTQISIMEATLEFQKENGLLWAEINQILAGTPASIIDYITKKNPDHLSKSETERKDELVSIGDKVTTYAARRDDDKKDTDDKFAQLAEQIRATQQQQEGEVDTSGGVLETKGDEQPQVSQEPTVQDQPENEVAVEVTFEDGFVPEMEEIGSEVSAKLDLGTKLTQSPGLVWDDAWDTNRKKGYNESKEAYGIKPVLLKAKKLAGGKLSNQDILDAFKARYVRQMSNEQDTPAQIAKQWNSWNDEQIKKVLKAELKKLGKTVPKFEWGGDIDFTGLARVDGTKNRPEHIFNFEQMEALRAHLLNGVDVTRQAISGLSEALSQMPNVNTYNNINNTTDSGITINTLEFHMEVSEIANDYDARRAGEQAMNEIVRIARKSGTRSLSRR